MRGRDRPELRDRDREVGQELEQEGLELVVGAVDLVDQQHGRPALVLQRLQQRPPQQELGPEQLARRRARLGRPDREQLALVVPVVDRVVEVDALVALQPDQLGAGRGRQRARDLGLAHARLALQQQRLLEREREIGGGGEALVGEVALAGQGPRHVLRGLKLHPVIVTRPSARACTAPAPGGACSPAEALRSAGGSVPSAAFSAAAAIDVGVQRLAAQRLLDRGRPQRHRAHVGQADAHVLARAVAALLDQRGDGHHRPVLLAAVELLVAVPVALERSGS